MLAIILIHSSDDDAWRAGQFILNGRRLNLSRRMEMKAIESALTPRGLWRVTHFVGDVPYHRALHGVRDYAKANRSGSRGVYISYVVTDGIYLAKEDGSERFIHILNGQAHNISIEEAKKCLSAADRDKMTRKSRKNSAWMGHQMTPDEFRDARETCGLSLADWAYALGYRHTERVKARQQAWDMENGHKAITPPVARLAEMFRRYGVPAEWMNVEDARKLARERG